MKILATRCPSWKQCCLAVFGLLPVAHLCSLGARAIEEPQLLYATIPGALLFGWFLLPLCLAHNLTGYAGEITPSWAIWYIGAYWLLILGLVIAFLWTKKCLCVWL